MELTAIKYGTFYMSIYEGCPNNEKTALTLQ